MEATMSKENLVKLLEAASADAQLMKELQASENFQEIKTLASARGFDLGDLSADEANRALEGMSSTDSEAELSDEQLENVAGGYLKLGDVKFDVFERPDKNVGATKPSCQLCVD